MSPFPTVPQLAGICTGRQRTAASARQLHRSSAGRASRPRVQAFPVPPAAARGFASPLVPDQGPFFYLEDGREASDSWAVFRARSLWPLVTSRVPTPLRAMPTHLPGRHTATERRRVHQSVLTLCVWSSHDAKLAPRPARGQPSADFCLSPYSGHLSLPHCHRWAVCSRFPELS